jgi:hypothetical protein
MTLFNILLPCGFHPWKSDDVDAGDVVRAVLICSADFLPSIQLALLNL